MSSDSKTPPGSSSAETQRTTLDWAREIGAGDRVIRDLEVYLRRRRQRRVIAATSVAMLLAVVVGVWWLPRQQAVPERMATAHALVLKPETRTLPDGSIVELKAGATIVTDFSGPLRRVTVQQGEAHFQVAKDAGRAFVVTAGGVEFRAVGTAFSVELGGREVALLVTEGRVAVEQARPQAESTAAHPTAVTMLATVDAGKRAVIELAPAQASVAPQVTSVPAEELNSRLAWRVPRLELVDTPLAEAVVLFNRYNTEQLVLDEPALGQLRLSGVLRADNLEALLRLLNGEFDLRAEKQGNEIRLRRQ
ncbi:MAG: FecR domain-containing protein [Opitutae bacterium]|nr:FecR domain-containing protein [Opitutae bacterium]